MRKKANPGNKAPKAARRFCGTGSIEKLFKRSWILLSLVLLLAYPNPCDAAASSSGNDDTPINPYNFCITCLKSPLKSFSDYLLKICVFQLGEYEHGDPLARFLIRTIKKQYESVGKNLAIDPVSLESYVTLLEKLGGVRGTKNSIDGLAKLDYMLLTHENVLKRIVQKGGKWIEIAAEPTSNPSHYKTRSESSIWLQIIFADVETPEWSAFFNDVLSKMGWERATVEFSDRTRDVLVTRRLNGKEPKESRACFLRCHSPGQTYAMENKYVGIHLSAKKDLCLFDYRGTHKSSGTPSEGGYYLDAETLFHELLETYAYKPEEIWVTGFCLGGAVAAYIRTKYHDLGVRYVGENTFSSLINVIENQRWPASYMGKIAIDAVKSASPSITSRVQQDEFNTLEKFNNVKSAKKKGLCIFVHTAEDRILRKESRQQLFAAASKHNKVYEIIHHAQDLRNPHAATVFDEKSVLSEYLKIISSN